MITIDIIFAQELPEDLKEMWDVDYDDYSHYLVIHHDGKRIFARSDYMEPEDATFGRDLQWVKAMLLEVYDLGRADHE